MEEPNMQRIVFRTTLILTIGMLLFWTVGAGAQDDCTATYGDGATTLRLATGSPGELGLVEALAQTFNQAHDARLCWIKAGSGASLKLLKDQAVDMVMVHAPAAEKQAVADGWATQRSLIGSNEFFIVGPADDPAGIADAADAAQAYQRIANSQALFFSRADNSGTHKKELAIWEKAGLQPSGPWYRPTQTFMMATLKMADDEKGYFMTDSSTWVAARKELNHLKILFRGDPMLINTYHALCQPPGASAAQPLAAAFIEFIVSDTGQKIVGTFGADRFGEGLYNDAAYAKQFVH
jgi:tungstate transport system substrate-binding protein